jgi:hypothetical protein
MTPQTAETPKVKITHKGFDLDTVSDVELVKVADQKSPVTTMHEFTQRLGNDAALMLKICNDGLAAYERGLVEADDSIPWQVEEDGQLSPFTGTLISDEKAEQLAKSVLTVASMNFGYAKQMYKTVEYQNADGIKLYKQVALDADANRLAKKAAKDAAREMLLASPATIAALKAK